MTRDHIMTAVRTNVVATNAEAAEYVLHVYSRRFNPEAKPARCPNCSAEATHRTVAVDGQTVDALLCPCCSHITAYAGQDIHA